MDIKLDMYLPFMTAFNELRERYGDEFLSLNGFANRNLNFTDFINNFVDSDNVANATIDSNANANMKDICSLLSEIDKPHTKLLAYNKIFYELTKKYGLRTAKEWLEAEWNGAFYLHDAYSASFKPYSYTADQTFYIEYLDEQQQVSFEQFYNMVDVPENYDYENDMFYKDLTNEQYYIEDNADLKATVKSILGKRSKKTQITRVMKHKNTRPIHRITLEDKTSIEVTNDHPIITETETKASRFVRYGEKIWSNTSNDWVGVRTNRVINGYFPEIVYDITTSTGTFICQEQYCHNCLSGDTKYITKDGIKTLKDTVGQEVYVLNKNAEWEHAVVKNFGVAELFELVLTRGDSVKRVYCTDNHHWLVREGNKLVTYETGQLKRDMLIPYNSPNETGENYKVDAILPTNRIEEVYCVTTDETHSFTLDGNILTSNCYAIDVEDLAKKGLYFIPDYNSEAPKHLMTYVRDILELVSFQSNRTSGFVNKPYYHLTA